VEALDHIIIIVLYIHIYVCTYIYVHVIMYIHICAYIGNSVDALDQIVAFDVEETKLLQTPHKVPCMSFFLGTKFLQE